MERDRTEFENEENVALYAKSFDLQLPEEAILATLKSALHTMDMLDLGVGAGRTAAHFAPLVRSYLGVDYSVTMIEHCRKTLPQFQFHVGDARAMNFANAASYDLVLFSYNGIDHMDGSDREKVLHGIKRVLRSGGLLIFSSHNANTLPTIVERWRFRIKSSLRETLRSLKWSIVFAIRNRTLRFPLPFAEGRVADGLNTFRSSGIYYIRPDLQIARLHQLGMEDISCTGNDSREFITAGDPRTKDIASPWVYYVCRKPRAQDAS